MKTDKEVKRQWEIVDRQTQKPVSKPYDNRVRASRRADTMDERYGAYRYYVREIHGAKA